MTSISYPRPVYLPPLPRNALFEKRPPKPWPGDCTLPNIVSLDTFKTVHLLNDYKMKDYIEYPRRNYRRPSADIPMQLRQDVAFELRANNAYARIFFVNIVMKHILAQEYLARGPVYFVTIVPPQFMFDLNDRPLSKRTIWAGAKRRVASKAAKFDIRKLQALTRWALSGIPFIAMVEAALCKVWSFDQNSLTECISWHSHSICFHATKAQIQTALHPLRDQYNESRSDDDHDIAHIKLIETEEDLERTVAYFLKAPQKARRSEFRGESIDDDGEIKPAGYHSNKDWMRTGDRVRMLDIIGDRFLEQLLFGQAAGTALARTIRQEALAPYLRWEDRRTARYAGLRTRSPILPT